jgi:pimeloyl-ACP methyl ester carboxylesterase
VLQALKVTGFDLVGQSLGALIAGSVDAIARHRLVLMSPALGYAVQRHGPLPEALAKRDADFCAEGAARFADARAPRLVHIPERKPGAVEAVHTAMASLHNPGHGQAIRMLASGDLIAAAGSIRGPVLLLNGAQDQVTPVTGTERLLAALQRRPRNGKASERLVVIDDAGHAVYLEWPGQVVRVIHDFLEAGT